MEFGNALYQDLADRYVAGKEVSSAELSQVWRNHTNPIVFDSPVYEQFFKTVRESNHTLPEGKRWRVLLGDPPIDWDKTKTNKDWGPYAVPTGRSFCRRCGETGAGQRPPRLAHHRRRASCAGVNKDNVTGRIESQRPGCLFIVIPHSGFWERNEELEPRLTGWKMGSLAYVKDTWLGALHLRLRWPQMKNVKLDGASDHKAEPRLEDVADAWLYVGPRDLLTEALPFPGIYRDEYWNELKRRNMIMWGQPLDSSDQFNTSGRYYVKPR